MSEKVLGDKSFRNHLSWGEEGGALMDGISNLLKHMKIWAEAKRLQGIGGQPELSHGKTYLNK